MYKNRKHREGEDLRRREARRRQRGGRGEKVMREGGQRRGGGEGEKKIGRMEKGGGVTSVVGHLGKHCSQWSSL